VLISFDFFSGNSCVRNDPLIKNSTGNNPPMSKGMSSSAAFPTTQWSLVLDAAATEPERAAAALEKLCARYWYPIYAFVRQRGNDEHTAEDLTQGFLPSSSSGGH
jgi:hypothetical protein